MSKFHPIYRSILLVGSDAHDFSHRMFSRNIKAMPTNEGRFTLFLSAEGKISSSFWCIKKNDETQLFVEFNQYENLIALIDRYHFSEKFKISTGPEFFLSDDAPSDLKDGFGEFSDGCFRGNFREQFFSLNQAAGGHLIEEHKRIIHRWPAWDKDYNQATLIFDLGFEAYCDDSKGCYIGQEVVERVKTRGGRGPRELIALQSNAELKSKDSVFDSQGASVGVITESVTEHEGKFFALAIVKRGQRDLFDQNRQPLSTDII